MASPYDEVLAHLAANAADVFSPISYLKRQDDFSQERILSDKPGLFLFPVSEVATPTNTTVGQVTQDLQCAFALNIVLKENMVDNAAKKASDYVVSLRRALLGFIAGERFDPAIYQSGRVVGIDDSGLYIWQDVYSINTSIRQA